MRSIVKFLLVTSLVMGSFGTATAASYFYRGKPTSVPPGANTQAPAEAPVTPGIGTLAVSEMGISDTALRSALVAAVGNGRDWVPCLGTGAVESCAGAKGVLFVHRDKAKGTTFGVYVPGELLGRSYGWATIPGFYFTNAAGRTATSAAYLFDKDGSPNSAGEVEIFYDLPSRLHFVPLYDVTTSAPLGQTNNGYRGPTWQTGWTLTGAAGPDRVATDWTAYKKK